MNIPSDRNKTFTRKLAMHAEKMDQVLFNSHWLTVEEATQRYRQLKWGSMLKVVELIIVFILMFFGALMPFALLALLGGIAK